MSELINAVVSIKDPFTLFAFLAVVFLVGFRTKTVPESVFKLLSGKITRERFYLLLSRSLAYGFVMFLVLCGVAVFGQVLDYMTTAKAASVEQLRTELALHRPDQDAARLAIEAYEKGLAFERSEKLNEAITSLELSLKAVPTAAARETLALLYQRAGDSERAIALAEQVVADARVSGGVLDAARAERLLRTARQKRDSVVQPEQASPRFGVGTITLTDLKARSVEVYSQESLAEGYWQAGYAGTLSPKDPALQVPAGTYKLKFGNHFLEQVIVKSGGNTRISLGVIAIDNLTRPVEVYSQESRAEGYWQLGYAGTLSPESPALQVPAGEYKLKFANYFAEHIRVESGKTTRSN